MLGHTAFQWRERDGHLWKRSHRMSSRTPQTQPQLPTTSAGEADTRTFNRGARDIVFIKQLGENVFRLKMTTARARTGVDTWRPSVSMNCCTKKQLKIGRLRRSMCWSTNVSTGWKTKCETEAHNSWLEVTTFTHPFWNVPFNLDIIWKGVKLFIYRAFCNYKKRLTGAFCNRTPKRQNCTYWSIHFLRILRGQLILKDHWVYVFEAFCTFKMLLLNIFKKKNAGCAMTFCKETSSRVEEQFCKNIWFWDVLWHWYTLFFRPESAHVFGSTQSSDSCCGYFRNHGADTTKCKTHFHGSFLRLQAPCQFVRNNPNFMAAILSFFGGGIWWRHQLSSQRVLCRPRFFGGKNREPEVCCLTQWCPKMSFYIIMSYKKVIGSDTTFTAWRKL